MFKYLNNEAYKLDLPISLLAILFKCYQIMCSETNVRVYVV